MIGFEQAKLFAGSVGLGHLCPVAGQVHEMGGITQGLIKPSQPPGKAIVDFNMVVWVGQAVWPDQMRAGFVAGGEIRDMRGRAGKGSGAAAASAKNKNLGHFTCIDRGMTGAVAGIYKARGGMLIVEMTVSSGKFGKTGVDDLM